MGGFGFKRDPKERMREMVSVLRRQKYKIQRDVSALQTANKKVESDIKRRAKDGRMDEARILTKELINSRRAVTKLLSALAHVDCIISEVNTQMATIKITGAMKLSSGVMRSMSALIKLPDIQKTVSELSKEMMKMGLISEMVDDTMEGLTGDSELVDDAVSAEVDKIINEITAGVIANIPSALQDTLPAGVPVASGSRSAVTLEDDETDLSEMQHRLAALRN